MVFEAEALPHLALKSSDTVALLATLSVVWPHQPAKVFELPM